MYESHRSLWETRNFLSPAQQHCVVVPSTTTAGSHLIKEGKELRRRRKNNHRNKNTGRHLQPSKEREREIATCFHPSLNLSPLSSDDRTVVRTRVIELRRSDFVREEGHQLWRKQLESQKERGCHHVRRHSVPRGVVVGENDDHLPLLLLLVLRGSVSNEPLALLLRRIPHSRLARFHPHRWMVGKTRHS